MASGDDELDKTIKILKSLIVPAKGGLPLHQLEREFRINEGKSIPLSKFGFSNITALVRSIPEIHLSGDGMLTVRSATLAHLTDLVARQKTSKPKSKKMPRLQTARFGARSSYGARSYSSTPVKRPVYPRSFNAPSTQRTYAAPSSQRTHNFVPPRLANVAPTVNKQQVQAGQSPVKSPRPMVYNAAPKQLPTVVYPGKKAQPATTEANNKVNDYSNSNATSAARSREPAASTSSYGQPKPASSETGRSNNYPSGKTDSVAASSHDNGQDQCNSRMKPESVAHRLVTAHLGCRPSRPLTAEESWNGGGDAHKMAGPGTSTRVRPSIGRGMAIAAITKSVVADAHSESDQLSARFAQMQMYKAQSATPVTPSVYPSTAPLLPAATAESTALANQLTFLESLIKQRQQKDMFAAMVEKPTPELAAWSTASASVYSPPAVSQLSKQFTDPYLPTASVYSPPAVSQLSTQFANPFLPSPPVYSPPAVSQLSTQFADFLPASQPLSPDVPAATLMAPATLVAPTLDAQPRPVSKSLKPMDRLLPQNLDNAGAVRARQTLEQEVDRERRRTLGHGGAHSAAAAPPATRPASTTPPACTVPSPPPHASLNLNCGWDRRSALMMIKPMYQNAQLVGDNLMMGVAKSELNLEDHFVLEGGMPYRLGLCISGLTLGQAAAEVNRQHAIYPKLVICLGSIDLLMSCDVTEMRHDMLTLLNVLTQQQLLVQRVYICNLPPQPTATTIQCQNLLEFNRWLADFCSGSRLFSVCNIFEAFLDENFHIREQLFAPVVRINMADQIIRLRPWNSLGCKAFLNALKVYMDSD